MSDRVASFRPAPWVQDTLLALFVAVMQLQGTLTRAEADPATVMRPLADLGHLGHGLLVLSGLVLVFRRAHPPLVFAAAASMSLVYYTLDFPDGPGWLALFVALYTLTANGDGRRSLTIAAVGIAGLAGCWLVAAVDLEPREAIGWVFFRIGASIMSAALGESVRSRRVIATEAVERAELAERTREEEARARVAQERLRIAREVHDTVAHAIAVINVQAGVTAHVLDKRPERARETLLAIEQASSRALEEMRTVLGVLRAEDEFRAPYQGLAGLDVLLEQAREAGLDVKLEEIQDPTAQHATLPSAVDAAAYRIAQEAITNVIRHAGPTLVMVVIERGPDALKLRVTDEGPREPRQCRSGPGGGSGIRGMRERCQLLGGWVEAGPILGAGFEVRAVLPLTSPQAPVA